MGVNVELRGEQKEDQQLKDSLAQYSKIYLYGAGVVAFGAYKAIQKLFGITVIGFLVTEEGKSCQIEGIPIIKIEKAKIDKRNSLILIAAPEEYHSNMEWKLKELGIENYIKLDSHMEYVLMGTYLNCIRSLRLIEDFQTKGGLQPVNVCQIYMAVSHEDKKLKKVYKNEAWIKKIQAGATLTTERITEFTDEGEDSLSLENALYGELTVTYYIWKYNRHAVTGLFHYRRILEVTEEQLGLLWKKKIDVILPLPFVCTPDASGQYGRYLLPEDIEIMMNVMKENESENFAEIENILKMPYLYNYNILIARKEVFDDYCSWLFPILKEITYRCEKVKRNRLPRYVGRIGEVLTSIYFVRNSKNWNIAHAKKIWRI